MMHLVDQVIDATMGVVGQSRASLHEPYFGGNEKIYLEECIDSTFVSSVGPYVEKFEKELASYIGVRHAVAMANGTAALQVALHITGIQPRDEVFVPTATFVATANAVTYVGAIPHFLDCGQDCLGLDPDAFRSWLNYIAEYNSGSYRNRLTGRRLAAVIPMHVFGHPCDMERLVSIAHDFRLTLIEDAAESLGSVYKGHHTGTFGIAAAISFNGNKIITTGGGGALITNDTGLAKQAKHITTTAKKPHPWAYEHDEIGFNFRMPNLNAALGLAQMEQLPDFLRAKRKLFLNYKEAFDGLNIGTILEEPAESCSNYWLQCLILDHDKILLREEILAKAHERGIGMRPLWRLLHTLPIYSESPKASINNAQSFEQRLISLPSSSQLIKYK
jgi:perosamine synthetase